MGGWFSKQKGGGESESTGPASPIINEQPESRVETGGVHVIEFHGGTFGGTMFLIVLILVVAACLAFCYRRMRKRWGTKYGRAGQNEVDYEYIFQTVIAAQQQQQQALTRLPYMQPPGAHPAMRGLHQPDLAPPAAAPPPSVPPTPTAVGAEYVKACLESIREQEEKRRAEENILSLMR